MGAAIPRLLRNLTALAERHGLVTTLHAGPALIDREDAEHIRCEWTGTRQQLIATGLFTPAVVLSLRMCRSTRICSRCPVTPVVHFSRRCSSGG
jgi:hypothetical protein